MSLRRWLVGVVLSCIVVAPTAGSQASSAASDRASVAAPVTVTLVTFGQGTEVFERFGHDALWFHDARTGEDVAYHWGLFDFNEPHFVARFVSGDTRYSMGGMSAPALIAAERRTGRAVTLQRLALAPAQAQSLLDFVRWNARDENRFYRYDYYRDNCATRLRDALDRALGGALKARFDTVRTTLTYRSESVRLTDGDRPAQLGIDLALGRPADRPLTVWESFFIPMRLRDALRTVHVADGTGASVSLVAEETVMPSVPGMEPPRERTRAPRLVWRYLLCGLVLAAVVVGLGIMMRSRRGAAWGLAVLAAAWWLLCGVLGVLIALAWGATRHVFWAWNEHLLLLTPLCLALVVLAPMTLLSGRAASASRIVCALVVAVGVVAALLAMIPGGQSSGAIVGLLLPVHLALGWATTSHRTGRTRVTP